MDEKNSHPRKELFLRNQGSVGLNVGLRDVEEAK